LNEPKKKSILLIISNEWSISVYYSFVLPIEARVNFKLIILILSPILYFSFI